MRERRQRDDEHPQPLRLQRHVDRHGVAAAGRDREQAIVGRRGEVPPEDRAEPLDVLQEHRLPLPVRADDRVVIRHRQLDDRMEARERPVAREHLLDGHPRVARPEDVDEPSRQDRRREPRRASRIAVELRRLDRVERRSRTARRGTGARTSSCRFMRSIGRRVDPALRKRTSRRRRSTRPRDEPRGRLAKIERRLGASSGGPGRRPEAAWSRGRRDCRVVDRAGGHRRLDQPGASRLNRIRSPGIPSRGGIVNARTAPLLAA